MFGKSKLQNAKQKISKLKEKYFSNSNLNKDHGFTSDLPSSTVLVDSDKPEKDQSNAHVLNETISPFHELISPRIEITNVFDDTEHNKGAEISSQTLFNNQSLTNHQDIRFSNRSPSEQSYCSKNTNKTLKTESIVLSDLSNQFEHICFLSSSSEEENTAAFQLASFGFPQTIRNLDNSFTLGLHQSSVRSFDGNFETKQTNELSLQKIEGSSSELSEVQSDVNSILFSDKEVESVKVYSDPDTFETNNSEVDILRKKENKYSEDSGNSYKTVSNKKQTSSSDENFELNSSSRTHIDDKITEPSKKLSIELMPLKHSLTKQKRHKNYKTTDIINVSNLKLGPKLNNVDNSNRKFKDGEGEKSYHRYIDRCRPTKVSDDNSRLVHEGDSSLPKKSRCKYKNRSRTILKHSTNLKPSKNRPILKSCVLIKHDDYPEEKRFLSSPRMSLSKLDGNFIFVETKCLIYPLVSMM